MRADHRWWVRQRQASEPDADFLTLSKDQSHNVRSEVAGNLHTPPEILRDLASDQVSDVRCAVAGNPHTPTEALYDLAKDPIFYVRGTVLSNPNTSLDIVQILLRSESIWFCYQATLKHFFPGIWANTFLGQFRFLP